MSALGQLNCGMCLPGWCRETITVSTRRRLVGEAPRTAADDSKVARGPLRQRIQGRRAAEPGPA